MDVTNVTTFKLNYKKAYHKPCRTLCKNTSKNLNKHSQFSYLSGIKRVLKWGKGLFKPISLNLFIEGR